MGMNDRELLRLLGQGPVSGDALARGAGQTRAAVWKRVRQLREAGIGIDARPGQGYVLRAPVDLLDADAILMALPDAARAGIATCDVAWSIDSTNTELLRRATPDTGLAVLLAERQTAGRGRRGRAWQSPLAANVYLSVARQFPGGLARLGGLSLVAGIAVAQALHGLGVAGIGLKWPNDLVVDGRKLGGLLVEGGGEHGGPVRAVVGIGLNVRMPEREAAAIDQPWIDLAGAGCGQLARNAVAAAVLARIAPALAQFDREGLAPFLAQYAQVDALRDRAIVVHAGGETIEGAARGIAADGALRVETGGALRSFHAGEVSVRGR